MRVLLLTQYFPPEIGAAQTRLAAVTSHLAGRGMEVEVVTSLPNYPNGTIDQAYRGRVLRVDRTGDVHVLRVWMYAAMGTGSRRVLSYFSFALTCVLGLLRARKPDVLVIESPPLVVALPGIIYGRIRRVPTVLIVADLWPDAIVAVGALGEGRILNSMRRFEQWTYRRVSLITTVTEGLLERLVDRNVPRDKIVLLPNGVDTELFRTEPAPSKDLDALNLPARPFLVYAGTMGLAHGLGPLIDCMSLLADEPGAPVLLMLGSGSERPRFEREVADRGLANVVFRDPIEPRALAEVLPHAMAAVVTSAEIPLNETSRPAKLFPVMAAGLPVVFAGRGEGAREVTRVDAGIVVSNVAADIAVAIMQLSGDAGLRRRLGDNARSAVEHRWSWAQQLAPWCQAVESLQS